MITAYFRGWKITWEDNKWVYMDTKEPTPMFGGKIRPCKKCGKIFSLNSYDPCLGYLDGVKQACCGHGVRKEFYIVFNNGLRLTWKKKKCVLNVL